MTDVRHVAAHWDADARVWWADSEDIPGLVTEAPTFEGLIARAGAVIPELLGDNGRAHEVVIVEYHSDRSSDVELIGRQTLGGPVNV